MTSPDDINVLAGEYVLGTLDHGERVAVEARRLREQDLDAAIRGWELKLSPLLHLPTSVAPTEGLLQKIEAQIDLGPLPLALPHGLTSGTARGGTPPNPGALEIQARRLARSASRWRGLALAATMSSLLLGGTLAYRELSRPTGAQQFVGVFNKDDQSPAFMLSVDLATKTMTVRLINADRPRDKSYQLWIKTDQASPPRSLGVMTSVVDDGSFAVTTALAPFEPAVLRQATFGVSLEDLGGSRTGRPADNALHATLITARP